MMKARLAAIGAAALASVACVHAASVPLRDPAQARIAAQAPPAVGESPATDVAIEAARLAQRPRTQQPGAGGETPLHSYLISAGQYVLQVGSLSEPSDAQPSSITDVPLPGAIWLFGSALLAFVGISGRRKL